MGSGYCAAGYTWRSEGMDVAEWRLETLRVVGRYSWVLSVTQWLPAFQRTGCQCECSVRKQQRE